MENTTTTNNSTMTTATTESINPAATTYMAPAKTRLQVINAIIGLFEGNADLFNACIEELDSYNGYLGDDRYYEMDMLADFYCDCKPIELLERAFYGYDEDDYHTDSYGREEYGAFNPNRDYFRYNGYGNLVSADYKDYSNYLDDWAIEQMAKYRADIYSIDADPELSALFDELENIDD